MRANTFGLSLGAMLLFFFAVLCLQAAPVPKHKPKPVVEQVWPVGRWDMIFAGCSYVVSLGKTGSYEECILNGNGRWIGSWTWCSDTRVLLVHARPEPGMKWLFWSIRLDNNLSGVCSGAFDTTVSFKREQSKK